MTNDKIGYATRDIPAGMFITVDAITMKSPDIKYLPHGKKKMRRLIDLLIIKGGVVIR